MVGQLTWTGIGDDRRDEFLWQFKCVDADGVGDADALHVVAHNLTQVVRARLESEDTAKQIMNSNAELRYNIENNE